MPSTPEVRRQQRAAMRVRGPGRPRSDRTEEQKRERKRIKQQQQRSMWRQHATASTAAAADQVEAAAEVARAVDAAVDVDVAAAAGEAAAAAAAAADATFEASDNAAADAYFAATAPAPSAAMEDAFTLWGSEDCWKIKARLDRLYGSVRTARYMANLLEEISTVNDDHIRAAFGVLESRDYDVGVIGPWVKRMMDREMSRFAPDL